MLSALLRTTGISVLIATAACSFGSAPTIGSSKSSGNKKVDAGSLDDIARDGRVTTANGNTRAERDAQVDADVDSAADADSTADESSAAGKGGKGGKGGAGGKASAGRGGSQGEPREEEPAPAGASSDPDPAEMPQTPVDGGVAAPTDGAVPSADAGDAARPMVEDPIGVLGDLANRTAGDKTAATINKFLETLAEGEAPAESIREFLLAVDDEIDCKKNIFATECLAACQAVSTTCYVCILNTDCRSTLLDICGVTALGGCVPRR
jgi:hypothetical protein